jgi:small multidrug resistance family-3 protein
LTVLRSVLLFALAALAEIGGAWLVWQGVREHRGPAFVGAGRIAHAWSLEDTLGRLQQLGLA